jgi:ribonuclease HI
MYTSAMPSPSHGELFPSQRAKPPAHYLIAHSDGGARGNPGPAAYGVVIEDEAGHTITALSEYLGHQTNNLAEYQGVIAALEYAITHGHTALKVISDSELLVRQIKGIYRVKNAALKELHTRTKELISQLEWFSIEHALRQHNQEADRLANEAMDKGTGRVGRADRVDAGVPPAKPSAEFEGIVQDGKIRLLNGELPEGTAVQVRVKKS